MQHRPFRRATIGGVAVSVFILSALAPTAIGVAGDVEAGAEAVAPPSEPPLVLDVAALLRESRVISETASDELYVIQAGNGKRLMLIPVIPQRVSAERRLDQFTLKLAAGRFLAWYLPPTEGKSIPPREGVEFTGPTGATVKLNIKPPRLAKECVLTAEGTVKWSVPRVLLNSKFANDTNAYVLKVDRTKLVPPPMPRVTRNPNETPAAYQNRRRAILAEYQAKRAQYMITRKAIAELSDDFEEPAPAVIWAVFEASPLLREVKLDGPEPLPWKLDMERFIQLRDMSRSQTVNLATLTQAVTELVAEKHPLSDRAAAIVVTHGDTPKAIPADHPLVATIQKLLADGDRKTRAQIAIGFARHAADAPAAGPILLAAAADPDPTVTFGALAARVTIAGDEPDAALTQRVTESITRLIQSGEAPPIDELLGLVRQLAGKQPAAADELADGVELAGVHADRRAALILHVLALAAQNDRVAERWLDRQLLGGSDARLRNETLGKIVELAAVPRDTGADGQPAPTGPTYRLMSADHAILKLIALTDADVRAAAWNAAQRFRITEAAAATPEGTEPTAPAVYAAATDIALKQSPTPQAALAFMTVQTDDALADAQITRLLNAGDGPVRIDALRWLAARGNDAFTARFIAQSVDHRINAAALWYEANPMPEPPVTADAIDPLLGLLSLQTEEDKPAAVVGWFARQIVARHRPTPREWAAAMSTEQAMLDVLGSGNDEQRRGAAAGLASHIAWPTKPLIDGIIKLADDVARTETDPTVRGPKLAGDWAAAKAKLAGDTLHAAAATYIVRLVIDPPRPEDAGPLDPNPAPKLVELGRLALAVSPTPDQPGAFTVAVDPESVGVTATPNPLTLTINDGASLNALGGADAKPEVTVANGKIELGPAIDGGWSGDATLPPNHKVRIELHRVK